MGLDLDEEREVTPHPAIGEIGQRIADHGHDQYHGIGLERGHFAEQGRAHDLQEVEQNIVIDDVSSAREHVMIVPENRCDEKRELQEIANDELNVAKTSTHDRQKSNGPKSVHEQQQDSGNGQQGDPMQRNEADGHSDEVEQDVVAKRDENAETHSRDVEVDAQVGREYVLAAAHERGRPFADLCRDHRPDDDAEPDVTDQVRDQIGKHTSEL